MGIIDSSCICNQDELIKTHKNDNSVMPSKLISMKDSKNIEEIIKSTLSNLEFKKEIIYRLSNKNYFTNIEISLIKAIRLNNQIIKLQRLLRKNNSLANKLTNSKKKSKYKSLLLSSESSDLNNSKNKNSLSFILKQKIVDCYNEPEKLTVKNLKNNYSEINNINKKNKNNQFDSKTQEDKFKNSSLLSNSNINAAKNDSPLLSVTINHKKFNFPSKNFSKNSPFKLNNNEKISSIDKDHFKMDFQGIFQGKPNENNDGNLETDINNSISTKNLDNVNVSLTSQGEFSLSKCKLINSKLETKSNMSNITNSTNLRERKKFLFPEKSFLKYEFENNFHDFTLELVCNKIACNVVEIDWIYGTNYFGEISINYKATGIGIYNTHFYKYQGEFLENFMNGFGVLNSIVNSQFMYIGEWKNDLPHGYGQISYLNGDYFEGEFLYGKKFGLGIYKFNNGEFYEGEFKDNEFHGLVRKKC